MFQHVEFRREKQQRFCPMAVRRLCKLVRFGQPRPRSRPSPHPTPASFLSPAEGLKLSACSHSGATHHFLYGPLSKLSISPSALSLITKAGPCSKLAEVKRRQATEEHDVNYSHSSGVEKYPCEFLAGLAFILHDALF